MSEAKSYSPRLKGLYNDTIRKELAEQLGIKNPMLLPKLEKIVVNVGVGESVGDSKVIEKVLNDLRLITGQQPQIRRARKSIATFKLREGMAVGARVTLRGDRMWDFLDRLLTLALPRIRDFRGLPTKFDGKGNYTMGISDQTIFPEIDFDKIDAVRGMDISFVTSATNDEEGRALLDAFGFPFKRPEGTSAPAPMQRLKELSDA
ncbi:50S ribosomal protein L5 [Stomatohabitans albus]|uniref:50S ribosomal protein L5 n=1 Tax=Stomatohabitans albus TaxID=3110766 RepID=UPI00300C2BC0